MKTAKSIFFTLIISLLSFQINAQYELWSVGTAFTAPEGQLDVSVFRPARYGITKTLEVSAQPWVFVIFPNAQVKKTWYKKEIAIATVHGINYPSWSMNMLRKKDKEGYIPVDSVVPQMLVFKNEVIISYMLKKKTTCEAANYLLSLKLGTQFAWHLKEGNIPPMEKPVIYPLTSVYQKDFLWYAGLDIDGHLNSWINFSADIDFLSVNFIDDIAIEHKGMLMTALTNSLMLLVGYKVFYGTYPSGDSQLAVYPLVDISWKYTFKQRKAKQLDLFESKDKMF
jgi:hypothetical protein